MAVQRFDMKTRKTGRIVDNVTFFALSENAEKMLYRQGGGVEGSGPAAGQWLPPGERGPARKCWGWTRWKCSRTTLAEWKQTYHEAFRPERDFFYDPGFHGNAELEKHPRPVHKKPAYPVYRNGTPVAPPKK